MVRTIDRRFAIVFVTWMTAAVAAPAAADQRANAVFDKMLELESKRAQGVDDYAMDVSMMGHPSTLYYERVTVRTKGKPIETFRLVSFGELQQRQQAGTGMTPEAWQAYSDGLRQTGSAMSDEMDKGMNEAGLPRGMRERMGSGAASEPWASPDPGTMMGSMADFAEAGGAAQSGAGSSAAADDAAMHEQMKLFRKNAKVIGQERIGDKLGIHLRAKDLKHVERTEGGELEVDAISLWVDAKRYVPLKMRMEGRLTEQGQSRDVVIERLERDYRTIPGSKLYLPYRSLSRISGLVGPKEKKELEDAEQQLADLDKQLASMPPEQRASVEKMMESQLKMLRGMVERDMMEVETTVRAVRINTGLSGAFANAGQGASAAKGKSSKSTASSSPSASKGQPTTEDSLVQSIQRDLAALGYDPGNCDGTMSTPTIVAISQFQAENELEVTGEATPQLAGILAAKRKASATSNTAGAPQGKSLEEAQAVCLQQKIDAAKEKKKKFGKFMKAAANSASRYGGANVSSQVESVSQEVYRADATTQDIEDAADALGISKQDIEACRNP